jgi:predicted Kef-type K+ transport protein
LDDFGLITNIAVALGLALVGGLGARAIGLSPIVGYLAAGIVISPFTPGYDADTDQIQELAEIGVIFLMFGVGLPLQRARSTGSEGHRHPRGGHPDHARICTRHQHRLAV